MKYLTAVGALAFALTLSTPPAPVGSAVGKPLPEAELEDFALTKAESLDDYVGRTVLIEFFAYW